MKYFFTITILLSGLHIFAQDSLNMSLLYRFDPDTLPTAGQREFNECFGYVTCDGSEIAVLGSSARVHFFDVTDPAEAYEIAWFSGGNITTWRDMKTYQDHVYSVCDACTEGLMIFDMADAPNSVTLTNQTTQFFNRSHNIFIDEMHGRLYAMGTDSLGNGLVVLDIETNPDTPILLKNMVLPGGYVHDMYIKDHLAFCNHGGNGMYAYDFTDLENPILLGTLTDYPQSGYNHSSWVNEDGTTLVLCDETHNRGVKTVNIEDLSDMYVEQVFRSKLLAPADTASIPHNPLIRGNIAFVSYYHDGVQVYDISDPANVQNIAFYDTEPNNTSYGGFTGCWGVYPFLPSGNILASDMTKGLHVLSLDNVDLIPVQPTNFPDTEITTSGSTNLCEGETVVLHAVEGFDSYTWTKNGEVVGNADSMLVSEPGLYAVCISNGHCSACSLEEVEVIVNTYPSVEVEITASSAFCAGDSAILAVPAGADYYLWKKDGEELSGENDNELTVYTSGDYEVVAGNATCLSNSEIQTITTYDTSPFSVTNDDNLLISQIGSTYQWFFENEPIIGATAQEYLATESGSYFVTITDLNGCEVTSDILNVIINSVGDIAILDKFMVYPNPVAAVATIELKSLQPAKFKIEIQNLEGKTLIVDEKMVVNSLIFEINMNELAAGIYMVKVSNEEGAVVKKINKQ